MTPAGDLLRPVHALSRVLDRLDQCQGPGDPRRGPLRQRAWNLARVLPAGALSDARAQQLQRRFRALVDTEIPLRSRTTLTPEPTVGAAFWLSSHDALGAVFRVGLLPRDNSERPFATFWPAPEVDESAERTAQESYRTAAHHLESPPLAPLRGWHRVCPLDPGLPSLGRVEGSSFGAALTLMLISSWTGEPLPQERAVTGCFDADGRLILHGDAARSVAAKIAALVRERVCVRTLYVPEGQGAEGREVAQALQTTGADAPQIVEAADLETLVDAFELRGARAPRPTTIGVWLDAAHEAAWLDRNRAVTPGVLLERLEALVSAYPALVNSAGYADQPPWALSQAHAEVKVLLCRYRAYLGDRAGAMRIATDLQWLIDREGGAQRPQHAVSARLLNALASLLIDSGQCAEASDDAQAAFDEAQAADDRLEMARILSTRGRIAAHSGDDEGALPHLDAALATFDEVAPWEANICRCYQVACLARLGRFEAARRALARAEAENAAATGMSEGWHEANALYLAHERLRLSLLSGAEHEAAAAEVAERLTRAPAGPWPAAVILSRLTEAALRRGDLDAVADHRHALEGLGRRFHTEIVSLHRDRALAAEACVHLAAGRPLDALLRDATIRWLKLRASRGPRGPTPQANALLEEAGALDASCVEAIRALLATDVY